MVRTMKKIPPEFSKGGWRRKKRRITPMAKNDYWPKPRMDRLRALWPTYFVGPIIVSKINELWAPRDVTLWHCWAMASHIGLRKPADFVSKTRGLWRTYGMFAEPRLARLNEGLEVARVKKRPSEHRPRSTYGKRVKARGFIAEGNVEIEPGLRMRAKRGSRTKQKRRRLPKGEPKG